MQRLFPKFSIIVILIVIPKCSLLGQSQVTPPGERRLSYTANNILVKDFFETVWQQTRLQAFYNDEHIDSYDRISVDFRNEPMDKVLAEVLGKRGLEWHYREEAFLIIPRKKSAVDPLAPLISETQRPVYGTVVDEDQKPIYGVTVQCGSATILTDIQGKFLLDHVKKGTVLQLRKLGYKPKYLWSYPDTLKVQLVTSVAALNPVPVNGIRQYQLTASIKTVNQEDIDDQPANNVLSALQGRVPGLYINQTTGLPGGGYQIRLRGKNSIESTCDPLIIVDGIPFPSVSFNDNFINMVANGTPLGANSAASPLNLLSINDIASIDILKDASATALYGSRGTNGVIVIHTKQTKENEHSKTINVYTGIGKATRFVKYLNTEQYLQMRREAFKNDGRNPDPRDYDLLAWDTSSSSYTDWQKELIGNTARITETSMEIKEGNARFGLRASGMYRQESTVYPDSKFRYQKISGMAQWYYRSKNKKLRADLSFSYVADKNRLPPEDLTFYVTLPPNTPRGPNILTADKPLSFVRSHPYSYLLREYQATSRNLRPVLAMRYEPVKGMAFEANLGSNTLHMNEIQITPEEAYGPVAQRPGNSTMFSDNMYRNSLLNLRGVWEKDIGKEKISVSAGASFQNDKQEQKHTVKYKYKSGTPTSTTLLGDSINFLGQLDTTFRYRSYYLQLALRRADKYILTLVANRDGSTRLSGPVRYATFGTLSAAWIFSRERWLKDKTLLSYGRIRSSYGVSGNDQYVRNMERQTYLSRGDWPTATGNPGKTGFFPRYTWEKIRRSELALDLGFKEDSYQFTFCYYNNRSRTQLLTGRYNVLTPSDAPAGFRYDSPFVYVPVNVPAMVSNTGFEIELEATPVKKRHFSWSVSFNISIPGNKLISLPGIDSSSYKNFYQEGLSVDMAQNLHMTGVQPDSGHYTFASDVQNSGKELGPIFYGGLQQHLNFHGFELSLLIRFAKQRNYDYLYAFGDKAPGMMANQPVTVLDRWQKKGDKTAIQRFTTRLPSPAARAYTLSLFGDQRIIETGFVRLQSLSLGYYLPEKILKPVHLKSCKFYLQGYNLFTLTGYRGRDPEIIADSETYPTLRIMTLGAQLSF